MGQKISATSLRVGRNKESNQNWFADTNHGCVYTDTLFLSLYEIIRAQNSQVASIQGNTRTLRTFWQKAWSVQSLPSNQGGIQGVEDKGKPKTEELLALKLLRIEEIDRKRLFSGRASKLQAQDRAGCGPPWGCTPQASLLRIESALTSADAICEYVVHQLQQRTRLKSIWNRIKASKTGSIAGIRLTCSGRLEGAEMAYTETRKIGCTSVHRFADKLDDSMKFAYTQYGVVGVRAWVRYV